MKKTILPLNKNISINVMNPINVLKIFHPLKGKLIKKIFIKSIKIIKYHLFRNLKIPTKTNKKQKEYKLIFIFYIILKIYNCYYQY